jgi:phytoene desaturase
MKKSIVIGSGIAGIATSIRLAKKGYTVEVYESNRYPGGKLSAFSSEGYRFDAGPSLFTMPQYVDALFELCDEDPRAHFTYQKKEIGCEYFWPDGTRLTAFSDQDRFLQEVEEKLNVDPSVVKNYLARAKEKFDLTAELFLENSLHRWGTFLTKKTIKALSRLPLFELNKSLAKVNTAQLKEPHLVQFYNRFATYNGSSPFQTPGIMTLVQHLESEYGTFVPEGGMEQISQSLYLLAKRQGVKFHFNQKVTEILHTKNEVTAVVVDKQKLFADVIVSNMDIFPTYRHLLPKAKAPEKILAQERSSSAVIFYWGIQKQFPSLDLHNIFFSEDYQAEFKAIFKEHSLYDDPTIYVNITAKDVPSDAPEGCENWFVMINTPADYGQGWEADIVSLRTKVLDKLEARLTTSIRQHIVTEEVLTPPKIQAKTQSHLGALYGASSNDKMAAFWRHPNFSREFKNLYFCGGSVHPGGGIPLCLLSAKIVSDQLAPLHDK